jgi:hypothetical protein
VAEILGVQRGFVELGQRHVFVGPKRRPADRPAFKPPPRPRPWTRGPIARPVDPVRARRDYDVPQRIAPTHSPIDPPPQEDLEPRRVKRLSDWIREDTR